MSCRVPSHGIVWNSSRMTPASSANSAWGTLKVDAGRNRVRARAASCTHRAFARSSTTTMVPFTPADVKWRAQSGRSVQFS